MIIAALVGIAAGIVSAAHKGQARKKLAVMAWVGGLAVIIWRLYNLLRMFSSPQYPPAYKAGLAVSGIGGGICVALFALLVYGLCNPKRKELRTGSGSKVWFSVCIAAQIGLIIIAGAVTRTLGIAEAIVAIFGGVIGYILLLASRRSGFALLRTAVVMSVTAGMASGLLVPRPTAASILLPLAGLVNPFITWLVIIRNERRNEDKA
jgi:hypothetical protein